MTETFFTADLHFGHANIIGYCNRPFADVEAMNEGLIANWNSVVSPDDRVWIVGDLAMGKISETLLLVPRLNGRIYLVPGNHDRCWPGDGRVKAEAWRDKYLDAGITGIYDARPDTKTVNAFPDFDMSHFPYYTDERHVSDAINPPDLGEWLVHGHVHDAWTVRGRQINVGVDVWGYKPVPLSTILEIIDNE